MGLSKCMVMVAEPKPLVLRHLFAIECAGKRLGVPNTGEVPPFETALCHKRHNVILGGDVVTAFLDIDV